MPHASEGTSSSSAFLPAGSSSSSCSPKITRRTLKNSRINRLEGHPAVFVIVAVVVAVVVVVSASAAGRRPLGACKLNESLLLRRKNLFLSHAVRARFVTFFQRAVGTEGRSTGVGRQCNERETRTHTTQGESVRFRLVSNRTYRCSLLFFSHFDSQQLLLLAVFQSSAILTLHWFTKNIHSHAVRVSNSGCQLQTHFLPLLTQVSLWLCLEMGRSFSLQPRRLATRAAY
jgi:hypothetical protein